MKNSIALILILVLAAYTVVITALITVGANYLIRRVVRRIHRGEISA